MFLRIREPVQISETGKFGTVPFLGGLFGTFQCAVSHLLAHKSERRGFGSALTVPPFFETL